MTQDNCLPSSNHLNRCWLITKQTLQNIFQLTFIWDSKVFIHKNPFANATCKISFILFRPDILNATFSNALVATLGGQKLNYNTALYVSDFNCIRQIVHCMGPKAVLLQPYGLCINANSLVPGRSYSNCFERVIFTLVLEIDVISAHREIAI